MGQSIRDNILTVLIASQSQYLSGEELSRQAGVSRTAIWKHMEELRQEGYEIEARPRHGYRLVYRPDRVAPEEIAPHLNSNKFGKQIRYQYQTESTQLIAHQWAREGAEEGSLVLTEEQTGGKGRLGRNWYSPSHSGIWMSLILRPTIALQNASQLTILASVGVKRGIERVTGLSISIKWPNDILINGKKVCGILTEIRGEQDCIHYAVLGVGVNVNIASSQWPNEICSIATSLSIEYGEKIHRATLIAAILEELEACYQLYSRYGFDIIRREWEESAYMFGETIIAHTPQGNVTGVLEGLDEIGALRLRTDEGIKKIYSAEVITKNNCNV